LKNSGYGIYVDDILIGCILYADDIILLWCNYSWLQKIVDICADYGKYWDIKFNYVKSQ